MQGKLNLEKVYVGIDPSLTATAIAIVDEDGQAIETGVVQVKTTGPERLRDIREATRSFLIRHNWKIEGIGIEHYAMGAKWGREAAGELGGVLRVMLWENGLPYKEIAPMQLKQFATGKGTAQKDHILMAVYKKWGLEFRTNDEADAFILAQMIRNLKQLASDGHEYTHLTLYEREVLEKLLNPVKKVRKKAS
jgi:crossover junction endodeoxyribonuclease RuvC